MNDKPRLLVTCLPVANNITALFYNLPDDETMVWSAEGTPNLYIEKPVYAEDLDLTAAQFDTLIIMFPSWSHTMEELIETVKTL